MNAAEGLRSRDLESEIVLIGREPALPYSPTILPYFISGKIKEKNLFLSNEKCLKERRIELIRGKRVVSLSPQEGKVILEDGSTVAYDVLILAQGGKPLIPSIPGLRELNSMVLRTLADAKRLRSKIKNGSKAIILGAGLIGMHTAQSLAGAGLSVQVVELMDRILPGYFDPRATEMIRKVYESHRVRFHTSSQIESVAYRKGTYIVAISGTKTLEAPLLLVATGVAPNIEFLRGSGIETDKGVLVDKTMRTNIPNIYGAGDAVQMEGFWGGGRVSQPILIHAVDQGRMAAASALGEKVSHAGNISINLFHFFGHLGLSIGLVSPDGEGRFEVHRTFHRSKKEYLKLVFEKDILTGAMAVDFPLDSGIVLQLIRRRIPLDGDKKEFLRKPLEVGRKLMCKNWR
jgi:phenylglyoxylate dehydrogenase epsilon subunit